MIRIRGPEKSWDVRNSCWVFLKKNMYITICLRKICLHINMYIYIIFISYLYIHRFNIYTTWMDIIYIYIYINTVVTSPCLLFSQFESFWLHKKSLVHLVRFILGKVSKAWRGKSLRTWIFLGPGCWNGWIRIFKGPEIQLVGGFKYFLFSPLFGEDFQFD